MNFKMQQMPQVNPAIFAQKTVPAIDATGNFLAGMQAGTGRRKDREQANALAEQQTKEALEQKQLKMAKLAYMLEQVKQNEPEKLHEVYQSVYKEALKHDIQLPESHDSGFMKAMIATGGDVKMIDGLYASGLDNQDTAHIKNYMFRKNLGFDTPEDKQFMQGMRGDQMMNLGDRYGFRTPSGQINYGPEKGIPPEQSPDFKGQQSAATTSAAESAKADFALRKEARNNAKAYDVYRAGIGGLSKAMDESATGPVAGRMPALTAKQQAAEGAVSALAPVLKQMFRAAGEGIFTDKDQELLLKMAPTRLDHPEARAAKLANIEAIVRAKLGMEPVTVQENVPPPNFMKNNDPSDIMRQADEILNGNR